MRHQFDNRFRNFTILKMLHVERVIKRFGKKPILTEVFFSCRKGEVIGLLGRNGSGKSTLLKIIFGSLAADSKVIKVGNKSIDGLNQKLINYLPQRGFLPNHIKIKKAISLFCDESVKDLVLKNNYIWPFLNKRTKELSGGELKLIELVLIIYSKAKYVLIDEPFNGVTPIFKENIKRLIREQSRDKGFIVTDHDYVNIRNIATKTILIHDGVTKSITNENELKELGYLS